MDETRMENPDLRSIMRGVIEEFVQSERSKAEPAYKAELMDERRRREDLERRVNELIRENQPISRADLSNHSTADTDLRCSLGILSVWIQRQWQGASLS